MAIYNRYVICVAALILASAVILTASGQGNLGRFYTVFIIEAFAVTELFLYLNPKTRRALAPVSVILLIGFVAILFLEILKLRLLR